jgi:hypothetical protein
MLEPIILGRRPKLGSASTAIRIIEMSSERLFYQKPYGVSAKDAVSQWANDVAS